MVSKKIISMENFIDQNVDMTSIKPIKSKRNAKRSRLTTLIKERAEKKKILASVLTTVLSQPNNTADWSIKETVKSKGTIPLSTSDIRWNGAIIMLDAINSGDVLNVEKVFREYCLPNVISSHIYNGNEEQNPIGPNSQIIIGLEEVVKMWVAWFSIAPDSVFKSTYYASFLDPRTGMAMCTSGYNCKFTRVLDCHPSVSKQVVAKVERLKHRLLTGQIAPLARAGGLSAAVGGTNKHDVSTTLDPRPDNHQLLQLHDNDEDDEDAIFDSFLESLITAEDEGEEVDDRNQHVNGMICTKNSSSCINNINEEGNHTVEGKCLPPSPSLLPVTTPVSRQTTASNWTYNGVFSAHITSDNKVAKMCFDFTVLVE